MNFSETSMHCNLLSGKTITFAALFLLASACTHLDIKHDSPLDGQPGIEALVTTQWLSEHLHDSDLVVLDATVTIEFDAQGNMSILSGRANYDDGHIPSAGFADLMGDLSDPDRPAQFYMPSIERFSRAMGALGVGPESRVVLYSANTPDWAARVWWMLRWAGFDRVALLDGGLTAWKNERRPLTTEPSTRAARKFVADVRPGMVADRNEVLAAIKNDNANIIDALPAAHFLGQYSMYDRPGHIVNATNMPSSDLLDEVGRYRSFDELEMMHEGDRDNRAITYCGGGVAASSVAFTMHRLGFTDVAVYMPSLQEWAADPSNPMALGDK
jgi:thiosulfate/3-mercaptopyruvate sulfurtransferase